MAAPILLETSPAHNSVGFPIGEEIHLDFDRGIDTASIKDYIVLYGADFDQSSGPDSTMWIDQDTGNNPFFLRSPGLKGFVELQMRVVYYDLDTGEDIGASLEVTSEAQEVAYGTAGAGHRVYLRPISGAFAPDTLYSLNILGDPNSVGTGVSSRTVFDVEPGVGNSSDTGIVVCAGTYEGISDDVVHVEITTAGDIGDAKYDWWFQSAGSGSAKRNKLTNRRYRTLDRGIQIRFDGTDFAVGDTFTCNVEARQRLATNTKVDFTTNDGSYTTAPDSPSLPATSEPPDTVIPPAPGVSTTTSNLQVLEMIPADGAFNVSRTTDEITILFSEVLDGSTITQDTVRVWKFPVLGWFEGQAQPKELAKRLTVSGQTLTIEI